MTLDFYKKTGQLRPFSTVEEFEKFTEDLCKLPTLDIFANSPLKKSKIIKGIAEGIKFDSQWEWVFYKYMKDVKGQVITRNRSEFFTYIDSKNQPAKFYPDFICGGIFCEIKGQFRENDILKMQQCPAVKFYSGEDINMMKNELNKLYPSWKDDYIKKLS